MWDPDQLVSWFKIWLFGWIVFSAFWLGHLFLKYRKYMAPIARDPFHYLKQSSPEMPKDVGESWVRDMILWRRVGMVIFPVSSVVLVGLMGIIIMVGKDPSAADSVLRDSLIGAIAIALFLTVAFLLRRKSPMKKEPNQSPRTRSTSGRF